MPEYKLIPIEQLIEPEIAARAAMDVDKLKELAASIQEIGYVHPIAVVPVGKPIKLAAESRPRGSKAKKSEPAQMYEIVDGHRRYKAGTMLDYKELPCLVFADKDVAIQAIKLHTALYREDLSPAEEAVFLADLIEKYDYTEEQLCKTVRQSVSWVNTRLELLKGDKNVFEALANRQIVMAVAQQLNRIKDEKHTKYLLQMAIEGGATTTMVAKWVGEYKKQDVPSGPASETVSAAAAATVENTSMPTCIICRGAENPYNFVPGLIHDYCKARLDVQIDAAAAAAAVAPGVPS